MLDFLQHFFKYWTWRFADNYETSRVKSESFEGDGFDSQGRHHNFSLWGFKDSSLRVTDKITLALICKKHNVSNQSCCRTHHEEPSRGSRPRSSGCAASPARSIHRYSRGLCSGWPETEHSG